MPWPGTPTNQQSPAINPPSTRTPPVLSENSTMADVAEAMGRAFEGLTVHEQAFAALPAQVKTAVTENVTQIVNSETVAAGGSSSSGVSSFNSLKGDIIYFPSMGTVNNQLDNSAYTVQQSDGGAKIIVGDSSAVTVILNNNVTAPWFTIIDNDSSAAATLMPDSGALYGAQSIPAGGFGIAFFDGTNWWAGATGGVNSGVTQLVAGAGISLSPTDGLGVVTVTNTGAFSSCTRTDKTGIYLSGVTQTNGATAVYEEVTLTATGTGTGCDFELSSLIGGAAGPSAGITNDGRGGCSIGFWVPGSATFSATAAQISGGAQPYSISKWTEVSF